MWMPEEARELEIPSNWSYGSICELSDMGAEN